MAPYQVVINEAFEDEALRRIASQEMTYILNCTGGRPSDAARSAVNWVRSAVKSCDAGQLSSPTAQRMLRDYIYETRGSYSHDYDQARAAQS